MDAAKEHRYRKVYNKLKDFEDYMIALGVNVNLPETPVSIPPSPIPKESRDFALLRTNEVVTVLKNLSVEHNIKLMNKFYNQDDFANLLAMEESSHLCFHLRRIFHLYDRKAKADDHSFSYRTSGSQRKRHP